MTQAEHCKANMPFTGTTKVYMTNMLQVDAVCSVEFVIYILAVIEAGHQRPFLLTKTQNLVIEQEACWVLPSHLLRHKTPVPNQNVLRQDTNQVRVCRCLVVPCKWLPKNSLHLETPYCF
jgi:hypothetical protein